MLSSRVEVTDIPMCLTWEVSDWEYLMWGRRRWRRERGVGDVD